MSENIRDADIRVTPALHPRNVQEIDGYCDEVAGILSGVEEAFRLAYTGIGAVHDARAAAKTNPTLNEAEQLLKTDDFAHTHFQRIAKKFDSEVSRLKGMAEHIEKDLAQPVDFKGSISLATEIRAHAKGLDSGQRMAFVRNAIKDGDQRTACAILGGPSYLSGFDPAMHAMFTRMYHENSNPVQAKRLKAAKNAVALMVKRSQLIFAQMEKAVGASPAKVGAIRNAKTEAEKAFILRDA